MKLEFKNRCLRLAIEFFPRVAQIRRYRVASGRSEGAIGRLIQRRIVSEMHRAATEGPR